MENIILLTGASGFIGKHILIYLAKKKFRIRLILRKKIYIPTKYKPYIEKVIISKNFFKENKIWWENAFKNVSIVINVAWYLNPEDYLISKNNYSCMRGTITMAIAAKKTNIKKFVSIGTCLEYDISKKHLSINTPLKPDSIYAKTKVKTYKILNIIFNNHKIKFNWIRLFNVFGDGENNKRLYPSIKKRILENRSIEINNPYKVRDFTHVKSVARDIVKIAISDNYGPFNVCSEKGISIKDFSIKIAEKLKSVHLLNFKESKSSPDDDIIVGLKTKF